MSTPQTQGPGSFFGRLFDFSFRDFVTPSIIRVLYMLALVAIGIWALAVLFAILGMFDDPFVPDGLAVLMLLLWPVAVLLGVVYARVVLEVVMVLFRISSDVRTLAATGDQGSPGTSQPPRGPTQQEPPQDPPSPPPRSS